jgi:hypothetical protein
VVCAIAGVYGLFRLAMLAYVSVYFGALTARFVISTYTVSVLVALPLIVDAFAAWRRARRTNPA